MVALAELICCELLKLKRSKVIVISILGVLAVPCMMLIEALQMHFKHPELVFTLADLYDNSLIYVMLLIGMMVYTAIAAYLFSREYTEGTLKTILTIPVQKTSFVATKFCILFLWIVVLTAITWAGMLALATVYHAAFGMAEFSLRVALAWLARMLLGGVLVFLTTSPLAYLAERTKGLVVPMIAAAVIVMGSAALSNQNVGALYPWTATFLLTKGRLASTGYPVWLAVSIVVLVFALGFAATFGHFQREDIT